MPTEAGQLHTGQAMVDGYRDGTLAGSWMGCGGGLDSKRLQVHIASGLWRTQSYEWRTTPLPGNPNWFPVADFAARIHDVDADGEVQRP